MIVSLATIFRRAIHKALDFFADNAARLIDSRADLTGAAIVYETKRYSLDLRNIHLYGKNYYWLSFQDILLDPLFFLPVAKRTIVGNGIVLNSKGDVLLESTIFQKEYYEKLKQKHLVLRSIVQTRKPLIGPVISLSNVLENNYYHWVTESLGRLLVLEQHIDVQRAIIVVANSQTTLKTESLFFFCGIPKANVHLKDTKEALSCDVVVASFPLTRNQATRMTDVFHPLIIRKLNERAFLKKEKQPQFPQQFILSRKRADSRRIINEEFLILSMHPHHVPVIECEALTFQEQVNLFMHASFIIATHGAGLTNIIFCRNATIIELFPEDRNERDAFAFVHISSVLGLQHHVIPYTSCNDHQDLEVDSSLVNQIKGIISAS